MCRTGGRRCPSYSDPAAIAARNARRRAAYAAKKAAKQGAEKVSSESVSPAPVVEEQVPAKQSVIPAETAVKKTAKKTTAKKTASKKTSATPQEATPQQQELLTVEEVLTPSEVKEEGTQEQGPEAPKKKAPRKTATRKKQVEEAPEEAVPETPEDLTPAQRLGITRGKRKGMKRGKFYQPEIVSGVINYKELDENSYKEFGFTDPREDPILSRTPVSIAAVSKQQMEALTCSEKKAMNIFTRGDYSWINENLYEPEKAKELKDDDFPETAWEDTYGEKALAEDLCKYNKGSLRAQVAEMDRALDKAVKQQKKVYRGIKITEISANNEDYKGGWVPYPEREAIKRQWLEKERALGTEVVFDGYASATTDPGIAKNFGSSGVMYEIITAEGLPIQNVSAYKKEREVLLPRQQRYMVVGVHEDVPQDKGSLATITVIQLVAINDRGEVLDGEVEARKPAPLNL